jgi:hypothetical protein
MPGSKNFDAVRNNFNNAINKLLVGIDPYHDPGAAARRIEVSVGASGIGALQYCALYVQLMEEKRRRDEESRRRDDNREIHNTVRSVTSEVGGFLRSLFGGR